MIHEKKLGILVLVLGPGLESISPSISKIENTYALYKKKIKTKIFMLQS